MAAMAVNSNLGCVNVQALSSQSAVSRSSSGSSVSLAWNPLHRRASRLSYLSSSASVSLIAFRQTFAETQRSLGLKLAAPRASNKDEELEGHTETENGVKEQEAGKNRFSQMLSSAAKPAAVAMLVALMLAQPSEDALAASGGRMGGKAFSAPRPAPSRPYSGGGGGGGYSGGRGYSGGGGGVYVAPPIYGSPYGFSPFGYSPFYGGGYGGGMFAPSIGFGGGGTIILAMIAFATLRAVVGFVRNRFRGDDDDQFDRFDD